MATIKNIAVVRSFAFITAGYTVVIGINSIVIVRIDIVIVRIDEHFQNFDMYLVSNELTQKGFFRIQMD